MGGVYVPEGFEYKDVLLKGRPLHDGLDYFSARHPQMDLNRRAKIFYPFDALRGFSEALRGAEDKHCAEDALHLQGFS